jgi:hypothetical protein
MAAEKLSVPSKLIGDTVTLPKCGKARALEVLALAKCMTTFAREPHGNYPNVFPDAVTCVEVASYSERCKDNSRAHGAPASAATFHARL